MCLDAIYSGGPGRGNKNGTWKKAYVYFLFIFFRGLEVLQEGQRCCGVAIYIYTSKCAGLFTV